MTHRALANIISWQLGAPGGRGLATGAATLQFAPLAFDASFQELFATWAAGGTLVLIPEEMRREPDELLSRMDRFRVARIFLPSVALQQLAQAAERGTPPRGLREVVTAGEQLQVTPPVRSLFDRLPGASLHNQYGPTEAHVVTALSLPQGPPGPAGWPALPAIGRPIAGARTFLLDKRLAPVPAGVVGRLYLGGVCLARGYHGRPDWTAERFLPSGLPEEPGERLYDTGDLARFRADGTLEFLGRADQQVKVRGYRVEPGEVEAALAEHPRVTAAAVAARPGPGGDLRLVAWVVPGRPAPPLRELKDFLAARLPAPLVPAAWVEIAALPRTPSGKVDRAALPDPPPDAAPAAAPSHLTPVEEVLAGIWAGILRLPSIGPDDNFFDLGGHSLTATTVTSQARQVFQVELPTRSLFESPTLRELAARIEQLLHAQEGLELPPILPAPRAPDGMPPIPLSFAQQRLWFLDELSGGLTPFYNIAAALPLDGRLDPGAIGAMARAVAGIVARHEALRTTFAAGPHGRPVQRIHPPFAVPLPVTDLRGLPRGAAEAEALRLTRQEARRPFFLARGPLLRLGVLRLAEGRQVLTFTFHHIVSDGWSLEVFVRELGALYGAALARRPAELPPLPVQYADFALWQQRWLAGPALDAQLAYWKGNLEGAPLVLDLPTDLPRPALQTYTGRNLRLHLSAGPAALTAELRALAREHRATLFMVLLAPFAALLSRASGQSDLLVGSPIANRNRAETFGLLGCFVNMLVLRADLTRRPTWKQLLARVRETALSAYAHQDFPFERLVEELQPARDLSRNPLFQASFAMASTPWHELDLPGLSLGTLPGVDEGSDIELFDLTLQIFETPQGLDASLSWNADLFDETTVRRLGGYLETLLGDLAHPSERPVAEIPLLGAGERHQLLIEWAGEPFPATADSLLPLFAERVRRTPAAPALLWEDGELAYEELDRRSNRLARRLASLGVGPESIVGLRVSGSTDFVTAALAVWKAGGAYLPIDPQLPPERQALLLADSGARALITRASLDGPLPELPTVRFDADRAALSLESSESLPDLLLPGSAAYVIYTSGSTGRPKGVVVPHGTLASHSLEFLRWMALTPEDRVLQLTSFSFDVSVDEIFPTLLAGAALVPWRPEVADPQGLARALSEGEITIVNLTTALWHQAARAWAAEGAPALPHLRAVLVGGEAIPPGALRLWRQTGFGGVAAVPLLHGYGLTETVVTSTLHRNPGERDLDTLAVGRPLAGRSLYLLDSEGNPALLGAVGEVHLGEPALARGYLGRPDGTAAAFVPDPWGPPGSRLYKTGDLARYRPDGTLVVLGRRDGQVKVRGFRIELGEIEAALLAHPGVREAAVLRRSGGGPEGEGEPEYGSLIAYVVGAAGPAPPAADLRAFLSGRLPGYMVPSSFVELPALPLTAGGKVDRRALLRTPAGSAETKEIKRKEPAGTPARPGIEARLADLWREILEVEEVRSDDNFFALGGHSMLLTLLRVRLQQEWGADLSVIEMFEHPTVASLARRLGQEENLARPIPEAKREPVPAPAPAARPAAGTEIAIVAMAGRFPGAPDLDRFWENLKNGVESISFFLPGGEASWKPPERSFFHVPAGGVIEGADLWDAAFFGVPDREADLMDPQHRLFLESAWEVLESAGYDTRRYPGRVGVFGGASQHDYLTLLAARGLLDDPEASLLASRGNEEDFLTTRIAAQLDLEGPCLSIQAACSTSLAAVHLARQSLLAGECDLALAGGVSIGSPFGAGYYYREGGLYSPDGHCRSYAQGANGSVNSDGVAFVVLKRLADAKADGDSIRAVILGTGLATDGAVPQASHRAEMIRRTLDKAAVSPDTITCVEGHGSATPTSDAMEVAALSIAFRAAPGGTGRRGYCALGSVKSNFGHLHGACGLAGLVKTVLALEHRQIPPTLHCERPNPEIDFAASPFYLNTRLSDWESPESPRRASVLSFGAGGINAQVLLEEALEEAPPEPALASPSWQLLVLSAKTASALEAATTRLADHLAAHPDLPLPDVAWTLQIGRRAFEHRRAVLCRDVREAVSALRGIGGIAPPAAGLERDREPEELRELGKLWTQGGEVDWRALHDGESRRRVPLPTYPFERRRHGFAAAPQPDPALETETAPTGA